MQAVILAAGKGTRLMPLTANIHKNLLKIGGKPILQHTIDALVQNGISEIFIVVGHKKEQIMDYFNDGSEFGARITYLEQQSQKGTADALRCAKGHVDGRFIQLNGDVFFDPSILDDLLMSCESCDGMIVCKEVNNPDQFGIVEVRNGRISDIIEKSKNPPSNLANMGMYVLPEEIFSAIDNTQLSSRGEYEITGSIKILIDEGKKFVPLMAKGFLIDIGRIEDYERANELYSQAKN
jgi:bifunctional UDP-N-acetylglucosamine pyrophosphorylase/glucosamine-1-phosphate N-acetyltransferase